jgi:hypothetical protein
VLNSQLVKSHIFILASLLLDTAQAQSPSTHLTASASIDPDTHQLSVQLYNGSSQTATAYMLLLGEVDAASKPLHEQVQVGYDNLSFDSGQLWDLIPSGETRTRDVGPCPEAALADVTVKAVIYADSSFEGDEVDVGILFQGRADAAKEHKEAISILTPYPTTPADMKSALQRLRAQRFGGAGAIGAIANEISSPSTAAATFAILEDATKPITNALVPTKEQMDRVIAYLSAKSAFFQAASIRR